MTEFAPISGYYQTLKPFDPRPCQTPEYPITVQLTLAAIDPEPVDDDEQPTTLRLLKKRDLFEVVDTEDEDEDEDDEEEEEEDEKKKGKKSVKGKKKAKSEEKEDDDDDDDDDDEEIDEEKEMDEEIEEHIICTLSPKTQYQQVLNLTILPNEEVFFVATGSYTLHLSGNYVDNPDDLEDDDFSSDEEDDDDDDDPDYVEKDEDEDEEGDIIEEGEDDFDLDKLENVDNVEKEIENLVKKEQGKKQSGKKRKAEEKDTEKKSKKAKKEEEARRVKFDKDLIKGPTKAEKKEKSEKIEKKKKKHPVRKLDGGILVEDMVTGVGPLVKAGKKISVRYVGKLRNGKVFDKNVSGKPFRFHVGRGEVIKGWDLGFQGMAVGGERRIIIPAPMAYGSQRLPGIPANSELTFDVKLLSIK